MKVLSSFGQMTEKRQRKQSRPKGATEIVTEIEFCSPKHQQRNFMKAS